MMTRRLAMLAWIGLVPACGLAIGYATRPGDWYAALAKPAFTPPGWLFAPAWTALYAMIGLAGWRAWKMAPRGRPMTLWWMQLGLNFLWSPVFFGARRIGLALLVIVPLLAAILGFIVAAWRRDPVAASLFVPYATWVAFAAVLNGSILALN